MVTQPAADPARDDAQDKALDALVRDPRFERDERRHGDVNIVALVCDA